VDDAGFLECERGLGSELLGECVVPWESDFDLGESEF
jgi:hypothetical protein